MKPSIDDLIVRSKHQRLSVTETARLARWREAAVENDDHYRAVERILDAVAETPALGRRSRPPSAAAILARRESKRARGRAPTFPLLPFTLGGLAVAGLLLFLWLRPTPPVRPPAALQLVGVGDYATGAGETATLMLRDGTVVRLAPASRLRVIDAVGHREVVLEGRAYFAVTGQHDNPFRIITGSGEAVVFGTRFEVDGRAGLQVLVVEGEVRVAAQGDTLSVRGSEIAQTSAAGHLVKSRLDDDAVARGLAWLDGLLVFQDTPLRQAAIEIERRFDVRVSLLDGDLADETVRGVFMESEALQEIVDALCLALSASCRIDGQVVTIDR